MFHFLRQIMIDQLRKVDRKEVFPLLHALIRKSGRVAFFGTIYGRSSDDPQRLSVGIWCSPRMSSVSFKVLEPRVTWLGVTRPGLQSCGTAAFPAPDQI